MTSDTARCDGASSIEDGVQYWREGCETCLRRTAPRPETVSMIQPPMIIAFECEYLIEPEPDDCEHEAVFVGMADDGTCFYRCRKCRKEAAT